MSGFFGVVSEKECITDLFYGTDYHSHLGTKRAGMATFDHGAPHQNIHSLENSYFRTKFSPDVHEMTGNVGIGIISDTESQPMMINSHLGRFAVCTVSRINNVDELERHCLEMHQQTTDLSLGRTNPTELVALLITQGKDFVEGVENVYNRVKGSCSMLIATPKGIIAARDKYGRTPIVIGKRGNDYALASESHSYINLGYETCRFVGPGEIVEVTTEGIRQLRAPEEKMQICSFLWIYYGFPTSSYEGKNVEDVRFETGRVMGEEDKTEVDSVGGIPDSGIGMAIGYSAGHKVPYQRGISKYTPTWPRSFMPANQEMRNLVAKMKLIPNKDMLQGKRCLFCDDSIVRGTQLRENTKVLKDLGAKEVHMRIACPPLIYACPFINFSASKSELELITRRVIKDFETHSDKATMLADVPKEDNVDVPADRLKAYATTDSPEYKAMVAEIAKRLNLDSLKFSKLETIIDAIGLEKCQVCTHCFDGSSFHSLEESNDNA